MHGDLVMRGIEVAPQLAAALPQVQGDRVELQQVLLNLVVNACEAMIAGGPERRHLGIRTAPDEGGVRLSVIDQGCGFPAEQYQKMFQAFYTTKPQGLGLGLSISRSIVLAHRGRLWGDSIPGRGASFHIFLPARPQE